MWSDWYVVVFVSMIQDSKFCHLLIAVLWNLKMRKRLLKILAHIFKRSQIHILDHTQLANWLNFKSKCLFITWEKTFLSHGYNQAASFYVVLHSKRQSVKTSRCEDSKNFCLSKLNHCKLKYCSIHARSCDFKRIFVWCDYRRPFIRRHSTLKLDQKH